MARLEHVAIFASDCSKLKDFYVDAFGLRVVVENAGPPRGFFLADDAGMSIEIIDRPADVPGVNQRFVCHLAFLTDDVPKARAALEARGIVFETETAVKKDSMETQFFRDPEGNRCQIIWRREPLVS